MNDLIKNQHKLTEDRDVETLIIKTKNLIKIKINRKRRDLERKFENKRWKWL
jgi:hypothetical protein